MAESGTHLLNSLAPTRVVVGGSFATDGSGDPGTLTGRGFTATRQAVGHYRVSLDRTYQALEAAAPSYEIDDLTTDLVIRVKAVNLTSKWVDFTVYDISGGAAANLVSGKIHFVLIFRNTGVL